MKNSCGIFAFYDEEGIADRCVFYYLEHMARFLNRVIIVCNHKLSGDVKQGFQKYTEEIVIRKNIGGDAGAYQYIILNYLSKKELLDMDELVLFNDTMFGPFVDMKQVFDRMEDEAVHFWGITQNDDRYLPSHIQSYFLVVKKEMLINDLFIHFWSNLHVKTNNLKIVVCNFEIGFTRYFQEAGFIWKTLAGKTEEYLYSNPSMFLQEKQVPFIKRKSFGCYGVMQKELEKVEEYIRNSTDYPVEYIYENIDRKYQKNVFNGYVLENKKNKLSLPKYSLEEIVAYTESFRRVLIYGLTIYGISLACCLRNSSLEFVVTDEYYKDEQVNGIKVSRFSEVCEDEQTCMVVTLSASQCVQVKQTLNWRNVIYYW